MLFGPSHTSGSHPRRRRPQKPFTTLPADAKSANRLQLSPSPATQKRISYGCQVPSWRSQSRRRHRPSELDNRHVGMSSERVHTRFKAAVRIACMVRRLPATGASKMLSPGRTRTAQAVRLREADRRALADLGSYAGALLPPGARRREKHILFMIS